MSDATPKTVQRIRIRPCGLKVRVLSDDKKVVTTFECQLEKGHENMCEERGVAILDNGHGRSYVMHWDDIGPFKARMMKDKLSQPAS